MLKNLLFDTCPMLVHAQTGSRQGPTWQSLVASATSLIPVNDADVKLLLYSDRVEPSLMEGHYLYHGVGFSNLCRGEFMGQKYRHALKLKALLDYMAGGSPCKYVLFTDADDVLWWGRTSEMVKRFERIGKPILFNADLEHWPHLCPTGRAEIQLTDSPFQFLNAGVVLFEAAKFPKLEWKDIEDQAFWKREYVAHPDLIGIDHHCEIFQTLRLLNPALISVDFNTLSA